MGEPANPGGPAGPRGRRPGPPNPAPGGTTTLHRAHRRTRRREARRARRAARRGWPRRILLALLALVVLVLAGGLALYIWAGTQLRQTSALTGYAGRPAESKGTTWLLIGSDSRSGFTPEQREDLHVGGGGERNTDSLMLLHRGAHGPYLISLPRDSYVPIPGHGRGKINSAYALGGPELLSRTVEEATGLRLDHYAEVDFLGFTEVVDALGGVRICLDEPLRDPRSGADFPAGCRTTDGTEALAFVRARYTDPAGDLGRAERQRQLIGALADKALGPSVLLNPFTLVPATDAALAAVTVDRGTAVHDLGTLGAAVQNTAGGRGSTTTVPVAGTTGAGSAGDVVLWDRRRADQLFTALRQDRPIPAFAAK
ncbi:LCP family protein [Streptomyces lycii]|uniref:LCP family protein n=1 Tax=Streptomyces lycii TaxID=2654337 RepID=A0ABQ7FAI5_9ACTN|nr:LCP family protein [Streptomyces lycii]KAF4405423.1 LCP family protein [Streptomyces lycii]